MREIPKKNYIILVVLLLVTVLITILVSNMYSNKNKTLSKFYEYSNKITPNELDGYIIENPDTIIYISDKYDLINENFEDKLQNKIDNLNLKNKLVFIDERDINEEFLKNFKKKYSVELNLEKLPAIISIVDKQISVINYIDESSDIENIVNYSEFE